MTSGFEMKGVTSKVSASSVNIRWRQCELVVVSAGRSDVFHRYRLARAFRIMYRPIVAAAGRTPHGGIFFNTFDAHPEGVVYALWI